MYLDWIYKTLAIVLAAAAALFSWKTYRYDKKRAERELKAKKAELESIRSDYSQMNTTVSFEERRSAEIRIKILETEIRDLEHNRS